MQRKPAYRRKRWPARPVVDRLDPRTLLAVGPTFGVVQGTLASGSTNPVLHVDARDFRLAAGGRVVLRIVAHGTGDGRLDPGPTGLSSAVPGGVRVLGRAANAFGTHASVTLAAVRPGVLTMLPRAEHGTTGAYTIDLGLAGDVDGNFQVDRRDLRIIRNALGQSAGVGGQSAAADVNGDGRIGLVDLLAAARNLGASTRIRPLSVTAQVDPDDDPNGDGVVNKPNVDVVGQAAPGATVRVDRGADGSFENSVTAGADGRYRFSVALLSGFNPIAIEATDAFGQRVLTGLAITRNTPAQRVSASFDFRNGAQGWQSGFADLPIQSNGTFDLAAGIRPLPAAVGPGTGYLLQSENRSDDIFMFLKRQLGTADGIQANQAYELRYTITFASNAPSGGFGAGGAPGEAVRLKAGGSTIEPRPVLADDGNLRMNVDIGRNSQDGKAASVAGDIANGIEGTDVPYVSLTREHTHTFPVRADAKGNLWLLVGTDSGFEGFTALYYQKIAVELVPL